MLTSAQIQKDIDDFLKRGGTIQKLKPGESAFNGLFGALLNRAKQLRSRKQPLEDSDDGFEED